MLRLVYTAGVQKYVNPSTYRYTVALTSYYGLLGTYKYRGSYTFGPPLYSLLNPSCMYVEGKLQLLYALTLFEYYIVFFKLTFFLFYFSPSPLIIRCDKCSA